MNRIYRIRRFNQKESVFETLWPQTITTNILRRDDNGVLENYLTTYDSHLLDSLPHLNRARSYGTNRRLATHIRDVQVRDGFPLLLQVHTNIEAEPTLNFNGMGDKHIINSAGERIPGGQCENGIMFLIWDERLDSWLLLSSEQFTDITKILLPVVQEYVYQAESSGIQTIVIPDYDHTKDLLEVNYGQTILRYGLDYEYVHGNNGAIRIKAFSLDKGEIVYFKITKYTVTAKRANVRYELDVDDYPVKVTKGQTVVPIPLKAQGFALLEVNYGQTILRPGMDYSINPEKNRIILTFEVDEMETDTIVFRSVKFLETNGDLVPNNWGTSGNYRYQVKVIHEDYTATENNVYVIPVPNYERKKDELVVVKDNHVLIYDVDYTVDTLDQVVLLQDKLKNGDSIYFTIMKGTMVDVPNFYTADARGNSSQHLLVDVSEDIVVDSIVFLVKLKYTLDAAPTLKCIDGPARPIIDCFGNPVLGGYSANSFIWLAYSEEHDCWCSLSHSQIDITSKYPVYTVNEGISNFFGGAPVEHWAGDDSTSPYGETVIPHGLGMKPSDVRITPIEPPNLDEDGNRTSIGDIWTYTDDTYIYVGNTGLATSKFHWFASTNPANTDLRSYIETVAAELRARPGNLYTRNIAVEITDNDVYIVDIPNYNYVEDKVLLVNYGQTVLRETMDYTLTLSGIQLTNIRLGEGDIIQFLIAKQPKFDENYKPGELYMQSYTDPRDITRFKTDDVKTNGGIPMSDTTMRSPGGV